MPRRLPLDGSASLRDDTSETIADRWGRRIKLVLAAACSVGLGTAIGLAATYGVVTDDGAIGAMRAGPWRFWPDAGRAGINPYLRARFAVNADIPLASAEGLLILAREDDAGAPLRRHCSYRIDGEVPNSLFWTLAVMSDTGTPLDNPAHRFGFTATSLLRDASGQFVIEATPTARPGNWVPLVGDGSFVIALRLYGTQPAAGGAKGGHALALPSITLERCA